MKRVSEWARRAVSENVDALGDAGRGVAKGALTTARKFGQQASQQALTRAREIGDEFAQEASTTVHGLGRTIARDARSSTIKSLECQTQLTHVAAHAMNTYDVERSPEAARAALPWAAAVTASAAGTENPTDWARAADALAEMITTARSGATEAQIEAVDRVANRSVDWAASQGLRSDVLVAAAREARPPAALTLVRALQCAVGI